jgi:hypothetical protein
VSGLGGMMLAILSFLQAEVKPMIKSKQYIKRFIGKNCDVVLTTVHLACYFPGVRAQRVKNQTGMPP